MKKNIRRTFVTKDDIVIHHADLSFYLAYKRKDNNLTLRAVKALSGNMIADSYLSQIETGKIKHPSPIYLRILADIYGLDYGYLMHLAGYDRPIENVLASLGKKYAPKTDILKHHEHPMAESRREADKMIRSAKELLDQL